MQLPSSRETQAMNSTLNHSQMSLQEFRNVIQIPNPQIQHELDPPPSHDDFLDQMISSCWPDIAGATTRSPWDITSAEIKSLDMESPDNQFSFENDQSVSLASKLRQQQISGGDDGTSSAVEAKSFLIQQQLLFQSRGGGLRSLEDGSGAGESCVLSMPLRLGGSDDMVDVSSFNSPNLRIDGSVQDLYNGLVESLHGTGQTFNNFHPNQGGMMQGKNYEAAAAGMSQSPPASGSAGGVAVRQPRQRVRARRGQATDPHSIAERLRRERIAERMKALQELVPNANKTDKASMLDEIIDYVKFLQLQVKVLSMSRLGGAAANADISSEGVGDCIQASGGGRMGSNGTQTASTSNNTTNESMKVTEHQVAKLMEEDMGSAMQYLQGKGLCLMPISLASVISSATCQYKNSVTTGLNNPLLRSNGGIAEAGGATSSIGTSVLTVQSATLCNGDASSVRDKP